MEPFEFITYTSITPINKQRSRMTWCFAHNIKLGDPILTKLLNDRFISQMKKTISEDEAIISGIPENFPFIVNVPCDSFQLRVLKRLERMVKDNETNNFYVL